MALFKRKTEPALETGVIEESENLYLDERPEYDEGYDESSDTIVRLVSSRGKKKSYQVRGIEDVTSKNNWKAWIYLAPVLVLLTIFMIYPLVNTIFISFTEDYVYATGEFKGLTFENFGVILGLIKLENGAQEQFFTQYAIPNTIIIVFVTVPISTTLALIISVALNSIKWFQKILQTIFFLPYVTNSIAVGMVFAVIFDQQGVINYLFHLNVAWIDGNAEQWRAMIALCIYIVWSSLPFKILVFLSGLQGIDKQYYQAAQIDACSHFKVLRKITVPLLSPQILYIMITSFIGAFKEYTSVVGLFGGPGIGGANATEKNMLTIVYYVYENLQQQTSFAAAAAVFLFVIILAFTAIQFAVSKKKVHY